MTGNRVPLRGSKWRMTLGPPPKKPTNNPWTREDSQGEHVDKQGEMDLSDGDQFLDVLSIRGTSDLFPHCRVENPSRERLFSIRSRRIELKELSPFVTPRVLLKQIKELPKCFFCMEEFDPISTLSEVLL